MVEHFDIPRSEISITIGSLANSSASSVGSVLSNPNGTPIKAIFTAYVFVCFLPPYSARAFQSLREIGEDLDKDG